MSEHSGRFMGSTNPEAGGHMLPLLHAAGNTYALTEKVMLHAEYQPADARSCVWRDTS